MSELLKCPFCGGEAVIFHGAFETTSAKCLRCGVETELFNDSPSSSGKQKAIAAWNCRADMGKPATENKPITLEELRGMDGEPVWFETGEVSINEQIIGRWAIITASSDNAMWITTKNAQRYWGAWSFDNYGKTWFAYRRKPEAKSQALGNLEDGKEEC